MLYTVAEVARHIKVPEADLVDFAISRDIKYKIFIEHGEAKVISRYVNELVADFKREQAEDREVSNG
jgi:hypothetical protein